ncbi:MAG: hypothetical protein ACM3Q1_07910 [Bacteroidales bacterium]
MSGSASDWSYALVVFADATDLWWLRLLRPGFRHCFVALRHGGGWVVVDPMSHYTAVASFPLSEDFDLIGWYRQHGLTVVPVKKNTPDKRVAPFMPHSCVETVKRILGIREFWVVTPWQLFCHLNKTGKYVLTGASS